MAWLPVTATVFVVIGMLFALLFLDNGLVALLARALQGADPAAFAVVVIESGHLLVLNRHRRVGAVDPAEQALDAVLLDPARLQRPPRTGLVVMCVPRFQDGPGVRQLFPIHLFHPSFTSPYPRFTASRFPSMIFCANFLPKLPFTSSSSTSMLTMAVALFTAPSMQEFGMSLPMVSSAILDASTVKTFCLGLAFNFARTSLGSFLVLITKTASSFAPSATLIASRSVASTTATTPGFSTGQCIRSIFSLIRLYARSGAPARSGPYSGNA